MDLPLRWIQQKKIFKKKEKKTQKRAAGLKKPKHPLRFAEEKKTTTAARYTAEFCRTAGCLFSVLRGALLSPMDKGAMAQLHFSARWAEGRGRGGGDVTAAGDAGRESP